MNPNKIYSLVAAALLSLAIAHAQNASTIHSLNQPAISASSSTTMTDSAPDPSMATLIRNRARVFTGDRVSAAGVRYSYVDDASLRGRTPDQVLQSLSPKAITAGDHVRAIDIVVNLNHPLTIFTTPGHTVSIGTATVNGADVHNIAVTSIITMAGLTITPK